MIGNDVVDLRLARKESDWERPGFLDKIFTRAEQGVIAAAANPEVCLWLMWSMKEAAYKIYNRKTGIRAFIPKQLRCTIHYLSDINAKGAVRCKGDTYLTQTDLENEIIHTVAVCPSQSGEKIRYLKDELVSKDAAGCPFRLRTCRRQAGVA